MTVSDMLSMAASQEDDPKVRPEKDCPPPKPFPTTVYGTMVDRDWLEEYDGFLSINENPNHLVDPGEEKRLAVYKLAGFVLAKNQTTLSLIEVLPVEEAE